MTRLAAIAVALLATSAAWGQVDSISMDSGFVHVWALGAQIGKWVRKPDLICPVTPGTYRLETKIDTTWVKCGMDKKTKLILYEAKPDTLWRWIDASPQPNSFNDVIDKMRITW